MNIALGVNGYVSPGGILYNNKLYVPPSLNRAIHTYSHLPGYSVLGSLTWILTCFATLT
jgi:hypothetical protein